MIDPKTIDELKAKHGGDLHLLRNDGIEVVAKRPGKPQYRRWRQATSDEKRRQDAAETLVRDCIVHPDQEALTTIFDVRPGLIDTFCGELLELAGTAKECEVVPL